MKNTLNTLACCLLLIISGCYDELDKTEAFEPFTRLSFTPEDGNFTGATQISVEISAPGLQTATATAVSDNESVDLGTISFANGVATLTVPTAALKDAGRIDFTAENTDGRPFTTRYPIAY